MTLFNKVICTLILIMGVQIGYSQNQGAAKQKFDRSAKLPTDKEFKIGKLDNGMTYYIRKGTTPAGQAEFFIIHNVGSLQENDNQRGLAHFLEHMAFNGTKNFPKKNLLDYFNKVGVQFGYNINAYTSMDRTVYNISAVPVQRSLVLDTALLAIHDWSHYISCEPAEIEAERGVIREEWRRGDDARTRMMKGINKVVQTGSRFAERDVIGLMDVVNNFTPKTLTDYYHKWYRPDLQAVVVVGDIDVNDMEQRIIKRFSAIPTTPNPAKRETYAIPENVEPIVGLITDPESKSYSTRLIIKIPNLSTEQKQTNELVYTDVMQSLIADIMKERVDVAAQAKDAPFRNCVPVFGQMNYAITTFTMTTMPLSQAEIMKATKGMLAEVERLTYYGAEPEELEKALKNAKINFTKYYQRGKDPKNSDRVNLVVENFTRSYPLITQEDYHKIAKQCLESITLEDLNTSIRSMLTRENRVIVIFMPEGDKNFMPSKEDVIKLASEIDGKNLTKFEPRKERGLNFKNELKPIALTSVKKLTNKDFKTPIYKQLDSTVEITLANGTKVIWNERKGKDKNIQVTAFRKGGYSTDIDVMDIKFADRFGSLISVDSLSKDQLAKWCFQRNVSLKFSPTERYSTLSGSFVQSNAEDFFKLLYTSLSECTVDKKDLDKSVLNSLKSLEQGKSENTIYMDSIAKLRYTTNKYGDDLTKDYLKKVNTEKIISLYNQLYKGINDYIFIFSGPMSAESAKPLLEKYISNIPVNNELPATGISRDDFRRKGEVNLRYKAPNQLSTKASVTRYYYSAMDYNTFNSLNGKFFSNIMGDRYMASIREERGGTYHVGCEVELQMRPAQTAECKVAFDTDPKLVDELLQVVQDDLDKFVKEGPTEQEVEAYKIYLRKKYAAVNKNDYSWISVISNALMGYPALSDQEEEFVDKITVKSVQQFAKNLTKEKNRMTFVFEPK